MKTTLCKHSLESVAHFWQKPFIASLSSYLLQFCITIKLIPKETVLGTLIFERAAGHRLYNSVPFYSLFFPEAPSDHETTKEEPQESISTD